MQSIISSTTMAASKSCTTRQLTKVWSRTIGYKYPGYQTTNEPIFDYKKGDKDRVALESKLNEFMSGGDGDALFDVPIIIGDKEYRTDNVRYQVLPFQHKTKLARFYHADKKLINEAIESSLKARADWENTSIEKRGEIIVKAADMLATKLRPDIMASTMLGQAKTIYQAEIDSTCELTDFLRFNVQFVQEMEKYKPVDCKDTTNDMKLRGMEGFVATITPFNFTAIAANLCTAPALMGNAVVFKPSDSAIFSNYTFYKCLREAGMPPGVVNFVPAHGPDFGDVITNHHHLAGINFTGSVPTFQWLWKQVGKNLEKFRTFPKISGECGGKNFHLIHESADIPSAAVATIRTAYEFSGQKCSAGSRLYVPESKWPEMKEHLIELMKDLKIGSPLEFDSFSSAVIDEVAFDRIDGYIQHGKSSKNVELLSGGKTDKSVGYFIEPTLFQVSDPNDKLMREEIFGPVMTVYVYKDFDEAIRLVDETTDFALTGSIFAEDKDVIARMRVALRQSCGNFYINDKSTGAVVNQQPFGGARLSGTNDKPGSPVNLYKWTSPQSIKEFHAKHEPSTLTHSSML